MSNPTLAKPPAENKAEPPALLAALDTLTAVHAERYRMMREGLLTVCRTLEGRE